MEHEFECNQTCIDSLLIRCDTKIDCQDGGDENNCGMYQSFIVKIQFYFDFMLFFNRYNRSSHSHQIKHFLSSKSNA